MKARRALAPSPISGGLIVIEGLGGILLEDFRGLRVLRYDDGAGEAEGPRPTEPHPPLRR